MEKMAFQTLGYIDGHWTGANSNEEFDVINPATGKVLASVPNMGADETRAAIEAANRALPAWRAKTARQRETILLNWARLIRENHEELAQLLTKEQGKPLPEAMGEINYGTSFIEWFAAEGKRIYGDIIPPYEADKRLLVTKEPVGVVAGITPWNFPNAMITRKCAPALAAGCTIVIKPAESTPLSACALVQLADQAGVPAGVLNIVIGDPIAIGGELTSNPIVRKLSFTGSTGVGKLLMRQCAETVKKLSLELGGNAPFIVFDDADLDEAVEGAMISKFRMTGQTCVCTNRILVQDSVYDAFAEKFVQRTKELKTGNGLDEGITQGPLINQAAIEKIERHIADALSKGANIKLGGKRHNMGETFFEPTVLTDVTTDMLLNREEIFGPVAPLFRFKNEAEAIRLANDTEYGLAAYFYSRDISRVWRVAEALEYGMIGINSGAISTEVAPFGGIKESGLGREGSHYGIDEFLELKYMCLGGIK